MTSDDTQQGWRLAAIGTLGLVLLIGGLGAAVALMPTQRPGWRPDSMYRTTKAARSYPLPGNDGVKPAEEGDAAAGEHGDKPPPPERVERTPRTGSSAVQ